MNRLASAFNMNPYLKTIVSLVGLLLTGLHAAQAAHPDWTSTIVQSVASMLVFLVPNTAKNPAPPA